MGKRYDKEFKIEAVQLASEPGNTQSQIERDLGIGQGIISRWKRQLKSDGEYAFPGKGHLKPQDQENRDLKREVQRLRRERDILKKAVAIFSRASK
jgi:transposase